MRNLKRIGQPMTRTDTRATDKKEEREREREREREKEIDRERKRGRVIFKGCFHCCRKLGKKNALETGRLSDSIVPYVQACLTSYTMHS